MMLSRVRTTALQRYAVLFGAGLLGAVSACQDDAAATGENATARPSRSPTAIAEPVDEVYKPYTHYQAPYQDTSVLGVETPAQPSVESEVHTTFDDVAGADEAKRALLEFVALVNDAEALAQQGLRPSRGILMVGAPGTGKTLLARATAHAAHAAFYTVSGPDLAEFDPSKPSAQRLHELFEEARAHAPAILFIDEFDALALSEGVSKQLGIEMDGFSARDGVYVVAACNSTNMLLPSLLRPGRFDNVVRVPLPDASARQAILGLRTQGKPVFKDIDLATVAANTSGMSGAMLGALANAAALRAWRAGRTVTWMVDFEEAQDDLEIGPVTHDKQLAPATLSKVAVHEAGHTALALLTGESPHRLRRVTIVPRGSTGGHTRFTKDENAVMHTPTELRNSIAVSLGAYAAERLIYGEAATGVSSDLQSATSLAQRMVSEWGMGPDTGAVWSGYLNLPAAFRAHADGSILMNDVNTSVRRIIEQELARAHQLLQDNQDKLLNLSESLLQCSFLTRDEAYEAFFNLAHIDCGQRLTLNN